MSDVVEVTDLSGELADRPGQDLGERPCVETRAPELVLTEEARPEREFIMHELERLGVIGQSAWSIAGALLGFLVAAAVAYFVQSDGSNRSEATPDVVLVLMVIVLMAGGAYLVILFTQQVLQSFYTRELERRLVALTVPDVTPAQRDALYRDPHALTVPGIAESLTAAYNSNRRGVVPARWLFKLTMLVIIGAIIGISLWVCLQISDDFTKTSMLVVISVVLVLGLRLGWRSGIRGRQLWDEVKRNALVKLELATPPTQKPTWRLVHYLLLPRPTETIVKGVAIHFVPALVGLAYAWGHTSTLESLRYAGLSFLCFELLLYQGRYMVNDWRGRTEDSYHRSAARSRRLPSLQTARTDAPWWSRHSLFWVVLGLRLVAPFGIVWLTVRDLAPEFSIAFGLAIVAALAYEALRLGTDGSPRFRPADLALFAVVGTSYGVRGGLGFMIGSARVAPLGLVAAIAGTLYFVGLCSVLATWTLESSQFIANDSRMQAVESVLFAPVRSLEGDASRSQRRRKAAVRSRSRIIESALPLPVYTDSFGTKTHLLPLGRSAGIVDVVQRAQGVRSPEPLGRLTLALERHSFLLYRSSQWWRQPFALTVVPGMSLAVLAGCLARGGPGTSSPAVAVALLAIVGLCAGVFCARFALAASAFGVTAAGVLVAAAQLRWLDAQNWLFALAPSVVAANYMIAQRLSYRLTQRPFEGLARAAALPAKMRAIARAIAD